jgi:hypothetical protein
MKTPKKPFESHVSTTKKPMGDHYGTGIKQKIGRMREDSVGYIPLNKKKMGTPPKSVV